MPKQALIFFNRWLNAPFSIGAIAPSSRTLARRMAALAPRRPSLPVVELGGGTGVVTDALLEVVGADRLIVVERDPTLHRFLVERYPHVRILRGDAMHLAHLLAEHGIHKVAAIVSGLPLLAMPKPVTASIIRESVAVLSEGAPLIQFTYGLFSPVPRDAHGLEGRRVGRVYRNLPPASIWLYRRRPGLSALTPIEGTGKAGPFSRESAPADPWPRKLAQGRRRNTA